jgi:hypothetical protein
VILPPPGVGGKVSGVASRLPAQLEWISDFERTEPARACTRPRGAYANCLAVSTRCAQWLRARGVECGLLHLAGSLEPSPRGAGRWPDCDPADTEHWTVRVGDWSIDWTARQFRPHAQCPEVKRVDALWARWRLVEDWACHRCPDLVTDPRHLALTPAGLEREHRALARASGGRGPFPDPRHDDTPALVKLCACSATGPQGRPASAGSMTATVRAPSPERSRANAASMPPRSVTWVTTSANGNRPAAASSAIDASNAAASPEP